MEALEVRYEVRLSSDNTEQVESEYIDREMSPPCLLHAGPMYNFDEETTLSALLLDNAGTSLQEKYSRSEESIFAEEEEEDISPGSNPNR